MKTEELLEWMAAEENRLTASIRHWSWQMPVQNPVAERVTLFEGVIREDGSFIQYTGEPLDLA